MRVPIPHFRSARAVSLGAVLCCAAVLSGTATAVAAPTSMRLGFSDGTFTADAGPQSMDKVVQVGGSVVRLDAVWSTIAPSAPADATNPDDPAYDFTALDSAVRSAVARGLDPFVDATAAPRWAEGAGRPSSAFSGSWKPDPAAFGRFGFALAKRYSGTFTPAGTDTPLPRVRAFQAWNEPNLNGQLAPQWVRHGNSWTAFAPGHYRAMLNAFSKAVKSVRQDDLVITAGTSPYGGPAGDARRRPLAFWRDVLCVARTCHDRARFDVLSTHPYSSAGPLDDARNANDLPVAGVHRLTSLLRSAEKHHRVYGTRRHRLWVTELSWDSNPPDPRGLPAATQARYLEQSLFVLWKAGVDTVAWYRVIDQPPVPSYAATNQSGVFLLSGGAKPSATAFAFPFLTDPRDGRAFWGLAPHSGAVQIQRRTASGWTTVARVVAGSGRLFRGHGSWRGAATLRAVQADRTSLSWAASAA